MTVDLAASPTSATVTKGSTANALGLNFTAGSASDVKVTQIRLRGYVDLGNDGIFTTNDLDSTATAHRTQDVVQSVSLWDGTTQLGTTQSFDTNGDAIFSSLAWSLPAGTTKTVLVKALISNNAPYGALANVFMVDLLGTGTTIGSNNITAEDKDANTVTATSAGWANTDSHLNWTANGGGADANFIAGGSVPVVDITPVPAGTVSVRLDGDTPSAAIVTANTTDNSVTKIKFTSVNESFIVSRLTIANMVGASSRSITSVRLFDKNGTLFCSGALDTANLLRCSNDAGLFTIGSDHTITVKLNIDQEGTGTTGANSGDAPVMALIVNEAGGLNDDIKVVGVASGTALVDANVVDQGEAFFGGASQINVYDDAPGADTAIPTVSGAAFVIRKTQPTVATVASSTTLINGENTVYKFSVTAAANADVKLKRVVLSASETGLTNIDSYKVLRNGADITTNVVIEDAAGVNLEASPIAAVPAGWLVYITWGNEETVAAGTTKTYEVKASVTGAGAGDSMTHTIPDDTLAAVQTGTAAAVFGAGDTAGPVNFIWSDGSNDAHAADTLTAPAGAPSTFNNDGSADWTNGVNVMSLSTSPQSLAL